MKFLWFLFFTCFSTITQARPTFDKLADLAIDLVHEHVHPNPYEYPAPHHGAYEQGYNQQQHHHNHHHHQYEYGGYEGGGEFYQHGSGYQQPPPRYPPRPVSVGYTPGIYTHPGTLPHSTGGYGNSYDSNYGSGGYQSPPYVKGGYGAGGYGYQQRGY